MAALASCRKCRISDTSQLLSMASVTRLPKFATWLWSNGCSSRTQCLYVDFVGGTVRVVVLPLIVGIEFVVHFGSDEKEPADPTFTM